MIIETEPWAWIDTKTQFTSLPSIKACIFEDSERGSIGKPKPLGKVDNKFFFDDKIRDVKLIQKSDNLERATLVI